MNKNDCLKELKNQQWLKAEKKVQHNIITWVIQLGAKIMKQSQFDILFNILTEFKSEFKSDINQLNNKMDVGFKEVRDEIQDIKHDVSGLKQDVSELKSDMKEVKTILRKHDKALFNHGLIDEESF